MFVFENQKFYLESHLVLELLELRPTGFFWKDKNSVYLGCNEVFARSLGLSSAAEIVGKTDQDFPMTDEETDAFREDDRWVIETAQPKFNIEEYTTVAEGKHVTLSTNKIPLMDKKHNVIGVLGAYSWIKNGKETSPTGLTKRQTICIHYLTRGMTIKQIATALNLSPRTVEHYLDAVKIKWSCYTRHELIEKAMTIFFNEVDIEMREIYRSSLKMRNHVRHLKNETGSSISL
ncbi:MAG: PAS domain-containing protein [Gammaproteobacteria bacterium]|nr:PAS domain-containing protein [Gammaproteobacteria bacterium]